MDNNDNQITKKKIKALFKCSEEIKAKFKSSRCLLTISVGQESHEGNMFGATVEAINESFEDCIITLHDTLQRYTIALNKKEEPDYFQKIAAHEGSAWLTRNQKYYANFRSPPQIICWNDWLNHPNYNRCLQKIRREINIDNGYKKIFDAMVIEYLDRYCKRLNDTSFFNYERAQKLCHDYLVEECAVLCLWPETNCQFEVYTGHHNAAVKETRERFIFSERPDLLHPIMVGFNHRKDLLPQHFELDLNET